jgi:hybrid cluster-associated redox disulfide protein
MTTNRIHRDLTVQTVLDTWPSTRSVFIRRRMACVGCDLAPFMTIAEAEAAYGIPPGELERDLQSAVTEPARSASVAAPSSQAAIRNPESRR